MTSISAKGIEKLVALWTKRLRVQDWDISVKIVPQSLLAENNTLGQCELSNTKREAFISILNPEFRLKDDGSTEDFETILVHELLHIVFPARQLGIKIDDKNPAFAEYERGIDATARALVGGYRK